MTEPLESRLLSVFSGIAPYHTQGTVPRIRKSRGHWMINPPLPGCVRILILFFFLSYLFFAWAVKMGTKPIHLFCPAVSLLTIAWLDYTFPA